MFKVCALQDKTVSFLKLLSLIVWRTMLSLGTNTHTQTPHSHSHSHTDRTHTPKTSESALFMAVASTLTHTNSLKSNCTDREMLTAYLCSFVRSFVPFVFVRFCIQKKHYYTYLKGGLFFYQFHP